MATDATLHSDLAIPPGEFLEEVIESLGMSKDELAKRMGRPAAKLSAIFKGEKAITPETALQLETVVGVPAHIWTGLETEYRLVLALQEEDQREEELLKEAVFVKEFCYTELVKEGAVQKCTRPADKVRELQRFFGVRSLVSVPTLRRYEAAFRCGKTANGKRTPEAVAAWLRFGEKRARAAACEPYNEDSLKAALPRIRTMTIEPPDQFEKSLISVLADCGVAMVLCRHFPKTQAHGATFWLGREKAVLMLSLRGKWADIFWFSLFHELGHLLLHRREDVFLEDGATGGREEEADRFAANTLIPEDAWQRFTDSGLTGLSSIKAFARKMGIHPGIVVGRLQHDGRIGHNQLNGLRERYGFSDALT